MSYSYYVTYSHSRGTGAIEITRQGPIGSWDDVDGMRTCIDNRNPDLGGVIVIGWQLLSGPNDRADTGVDLARLHDLHARVAAACDTAGDTGDADPDDVIKGLRYVLSMTRRTLAHITATATAG